jgi:ribonuclease E
VTDNASDSGENQRRERRGRNDGRRRSGGAEAAEGQAQPLLDNTQAQSIVEDVQTGTAAEPPASEEAGESRAPREPRGRGRDRYGRDRRERAPREDAAPAEQAPAFEDTAPQAEAAEERVPVRNSYFTLPVEESAPAAASAPGANEPLAAAEAPVEPQPVAPRPAHQAPAMRPAPVAAAPVTTPAPQGLPKVQSFALPIEEMQQVAQASGLEWVNSNAAKVAEVQAAIAAEPRAIHVPREIPPVVLIDEGPLVLVETRKDLRNTALPFENPQNR